MQFYSIGGSFVDVKEGAALILVLKIWLTLKREESPDFIWNVLKITVMDFESVRPLILVAKNSLLLLQRRSLDEAPLIEVKSKANYRSCGKSSVATSDAVDWNWRWTADFSYVRESCEHRAREKSGIKSYCGIFARKKQLLWLIWRSETFYVDVLEDEFKGKDVHGNVLSVKFNTRYCCVQQGWGIILLSIFI